jgi:hypothetical protein
LASYGFTTKFTFRTGGGGSPMRRGECLPLTRTPGHASRPGQGCQCTLVP